MRMRGMASWLCKIENYILVGYGLGTYKYCPYQAWEIHIDLNKTKGILQLYCINECLLTKSYDIGIMHYKRICICMEN